MGIGYGLIRGLTEAATGAQQGIADRRAMQQKAMQDLLAKRLTEAQIANYQSEAATRSRKPPVTRFTDRGLEQYDEATDTWAPAKQSPVVGGGTVGAPSKGRYQSVQDEFGNVSLVYVPDVREMTSPETPPGPQQPSTPKVGGGRTRPPSVVPVPGVHARANVGAVETHAAAGTTMRLLQEAMDLAKSDENMTFPWGASAAQGAAQTLGHIGLGGLAAPLARRQLTPGQTAFRQKMDQIVHFGGSILPKGGRSQTIMANLQASYSPGSGVTNLPVFRQALQDFYDYAAEIESGGQRSSRGAPQSVLPKSPPTSADALAAAEAALGIKR
jgi:hypothetical protein